MKKREKKRRKKRKRKGNFLNACILTAPPIQKFYLHQVFFQLHFFYKEKEIHIISFKTCMAVRNSEVMANKFNYYRSSFIKK